MLAAISWGPGEDRPPASDAIKASGECGDRPLRLLRRPIQETCHLLLEAVVERLLLPFGVANGAVARRRGRFRRNLVGRVPGARCVGSEWQAPVRPRAPHG